MKPSRPWERRGGGSGRKYCQARHPPSPALAFAILDTRTHESPNFWRPRERSLFKRAACATQSTYIILFSFTAKNSEVCVLKGVCYRFLVNYSWGIRFGSLCMWLRLISFLQRTDRKGFPGFSSSRKKKAQIYIKDGLFSLPSLPIWRKMKVDVRKLREKK